MNALAILVTQYLSKNNLSINQLAQSLGNKNIPKALRNLDQYYLTLNDTNNISKKLPEVLNIPAYEFENAVYDVQSKQELKARSLFSPSIQIIPSSRPSPIFVVAMVPSLLNIQVSNIDNCNFEQELEIIFNAYKNHQLNHCSKIYEGNDYDKLNQIVEKMDQNGEIYPWTIGKNYRYFRSYDETIVFNRDGEIVDHINSHIEPIKATVTVGGKTIPPLIGNHNE